ncbi:MAG: fatty acid desaturase [Candidatus Caenarcaniphilales bacterium]|nr:fatty acid desaturase [Candidatus Caenarcaniphilales bacterium]
MNPTTAIQRFVNLSDRDKMQRISAMIRFAEQKLKRQFPFLSRQNLIGALVFLSAIAGMIFNGYLYYKEVIPAWLCVVGNAVWASLLHELEHDLIHQLYFRTRPLVQNLMMAGIWLFRGNLISPWYRKFIHLVHHRESGQKEDIEERLIGNGLPWGFKRFMIMLDPILAPLQFKNLMKLPHFKLKDVLQATFPIYLIFNTIWVSFLVLLIIRAYALMTGLYVEPPFASWYVALVEFMMVVYIAPNFIRQASLSIVSSNCHYYGDIPKSNVITQTQILQPWFLAPLQLFCFNFGSTHCIHHFVVNQPFYIRQLVAPLAHAAMRRYGVRFNDIGTFQRGNRYESEQINKNHS